jgi:hypothetical protein
MTEFRARAVLNVDVDQYEVVNETIKLFRKRFNIYNVDGIDDNGRMYENVEYHTSHSWTSKEDRGKPTPEQILAINAVILLEKLSKDV